MRTNIDALRSMKRYMAEALGDEWEVRLDREEGALTLPLAVVMFSGPTLNTGPKFETMVTQPMSIYLTPVPASDGMEAQVLASEAEQILYEAFRVGVGEGAPMRVPLYDYDGVGMDEGTEARPGPDYLRLTDFSMTQVPDESDTRRVTVTADIRATWRRRGLVPGGDKDVEAVTVDFEVS